MGISRFLGPGRGSGFLVSGFWFVWFLVSGFWFLVSGFWFLVSGFWCLVSGFWFLVSGCWFLVSGFGFLVSGFWLLVSSFWFLVPGSWFAVSGFWFLQWKEKWYRMDRSKWTDDFSLGGPFSVKRKIVWDGAQHVDGWLDSLRGSFLVRRRKKK